MAEYCYALEVQNSLLRLQLRNTDDAQVLGNSSTTYAKSFNATLFLHTSKVCGRYHQTFKPVKHKVWDHTNPTTNRKLKLDKLENIHKFYVKHPNVLYEEAASHINTLYTNMKHEQVFQKTPFNAANFTENPLNRDISASRNILIKGVCLIKNIQTPPLLNRAQNNQNIDDDDSSSTISGKLSVKFLLYFSNFIIFPLLPDDSRSQQQQQQQHSSSRT